MGTDLPTSSNVGQVTDPSAPSATVAQVRNDLSELVRVIELSSKAFTRTSAVLVKMSERLDTIEAKLDARAAAPASDDEEADEGAGPITEKRPTGPLGRLALRQDGGVLLEVTSDLDEADLVDREVARFVTLTHAEALDAVDRADVGFSDAAARAGWQVARARKGYPVADEAPTEPTL